MRFYTFTIGIILSFLLFSCSGADVNEMRQQVIFEKVEERVNKYKEEKQNSCQRKVLQKAGAIADSILLVEARLNRDTSRKPVIPEKPEIPEIIPIKDSIPVQPFYRDSSLELIEIDTSGLEDK
jgi:hypothetical protein